MFWVDFVKRGSRVVSRRGEGRQKCWDCRLCLGGWGVWCLVMAAKVRGGDSIIKRFGVLVGW